MSTPIYWAPGIYGYASDDARDDGFGPDEHLPPLTKATTPSEARAALEALDNIAYAFLCQRWHIVVVNVPGMDGSLSAPPTFGETFPDLYTEESDNA